jgi:hypothetical protein
MHTLLQVKIQNMIELRFSSSKVKQTFLFGYQRRISSIMVPFVIDEILIWFSLENGDRILTASSVCV